MTTSTTDSLRVASKEKRFDWPLCYEAENLLLKWMEIFLQQNQFAGRLSERMQNETGTLLLDWIDYLMVAKAKESELRAVGFTEDPLGETSSEQKVFWHPQALLPRVILSGKESPMVIAIHPESLSDFMASHQIVGEPEGEPLSRFRRVTVSTEKGTRFEAVERRGYRGYLPRAMKSGEIQAALKAHEIWKTRQRSFEDDATGFQHTLTTLDEMINLVGRDLACHIVFAGERDYWESRNSAGQLQKKRQDRLGLGWGNHDHHTFRCSRQLFVNLMEALDKLGFERRERYYAGAQAGWGAQILEQSIEGIVVFADVDLEQKETDIDFSRVVLPPSKRLGTVGLWVGLHGESFLEAGMHHLECRFDHALLKAQLAEIDIATMKPFSDFPFLKQAFTEGEQWPVRRERVERLLKDGLIDHEEFKRFINQGAIGSHLENLQRKGGYKGFNQTSVSAIIKTTDPRNQNA